MGWEHTCAISGISPEYTREPLDLYWLHSEVLKLIKKIVSSIMEDKPLGLDEKVTESIVKELLMLCTTNSWGKGVSDEWLAFKEFVTDHPLTGTYWPPNASYFGDKSKFDWAGWDPIAIGTFDSNGAPVTLGFQHHMPVYPGGYEVVTRLVAKYDGNNRWCKIIDPVRGEIDGYSMTSDFHDPNLLCCIGPFRYLEAWLNQASLPPRSIGPATMCFSGELYEIVTAQKMRQADGLECSIQYGGIEKTVRPWIAPFSLAFTSAKHLTKALSSGLRGPDLIPALFDDFLVWQYVPPNVWSHRSDEAEITRQIDSIGIELMRETIFHKLPYEVIDQILCDLPLFDALNLISISRSIIYFLDKPQMILHQLQRRIALPLGSLHWLLPVSTMEAEEDRFLDAMKSWLSVPQEESLTTIFNPSFPLLDFVRANYQTSSMKNRRRLWNISQQFRRLWIQYRTEGYEAKEFGVGHHMCPPMTYNVALPPHPGPKLPGRFLFSIAQWNGGEQI